VQKTPSEVSDIEYRYWLFEATTAAARALALLEASGGTKRSVSQAFRSRKPNVKERSRMSLISDPGSRLWRTDYKVGRNIYALLSNDVTKTSQQDPLIGTMESTELAEIVVDTHNKVVLKYGRHYLKALEADVTG
jgi:hypothetical protein